MFTGIITELGILIRILRRGENLILSLRAPISAREVAVGHSIAVNGVCLTAISAIKEQIEVEAVRETLSRTTLGHLQVGTGVNLELSARVGDRLHGHIVQGHTDCVGRIGGLRDLGGSVLINIEYPSKFGKYLIEKGSVAVDGISLTVVDVNQGNFSVSIIPHTAGTTNIGHINVGDAVNLEFDVLAKYMERNLSKNESKITGEFLREHGF